MRSVIEQASNFKPKIQATVTTNANSYLELQNFISGYVTSDLSMGGTCQSSGFDAMMLK